MALDGLFERRPWQWGLRGDPRVRAFTGIPILIDRAAAAAADGN